METCHSYKLNVSLFDEIVEMSVAKNLVSPVLPQEVSDWDNGHFQDFITMTGTLNWCKHPVLPLY